MKIAIIGSGIGGLGAAYILAREHEVTLFEADDRVGGHTHTHAFSRWGETYAVDTGFIVHNREHYPLFTRLLRELSVSSRETTMSFSVSNARSGLEYCATDLDSLFCQRRNAVSPRFLHMLADLVRFYREAPSVLAARDTRPLGAFLEDGRYGAGFRDDHLLPIASALWSCAHGKALEMPVAFLVRFMANHHMLTLGKRPPWRVVEGGSHTYVRALLSHTRATIRLRTPVRAVRRDEDGATLTTDEGDARFDAIVVACHADQALSLLTDPSEEERALLSAIPFIENEVVLHHDARLLPRNPKAVAAWNALVPRDAGEACTVSYGMHLLEGIRSREPFVVTLNRTHAIDPEKIIARATYHHPAFTKESVAAAEKLSRLSGARRTYFAGAYLGFGFHEDGLRSAVHAAEKLGVKW